ncbi:hypothetical protein HD806DRAFT_524914 [Xylariaceae sp. AK1471]|nr:hypothetical protein HD806DRAFT_524914 [Xylariaceae sp. AK1471]
MPPRARPAQLEEETLAWGKSVQEVDLCRAIAKFTLQYRPGKAVELHKPIRGGYNILYRPKYEDGTLADMRMPCKFPRGKGHYDVAMMRYVAANSTIPTKLYRQMASILLQLFTLSFPRIASLIWDIDGHLSAYGRPLIQYVNSLVEWTGVDSAPLPRLTSELATEKGETSLHIYSEDLRPANVLIDKDLRVASVYEPRLQVFLRVLEEEEKKLRDTSTTEAPAVSSATPLSQRMRESKENKTWMINYTAKNGWVFAYLYWKYLDYRFFGPNENEEHRMMESFVKRKVEESKDRKLAEWDPESITPQLAQLML